MDLDLDGFVIQLTKLKLGIVWVTTAVEELEKSPQYRGSFDLHVRPPGSGLPEPDAHTVALLKQMSEGMSEDQSATHREVIGRATVVYAWAVFENLLEDCLRVVYVRRPVELLEHASEKVRAEALRGILDGGWKASEVATLLLEAELRKFRNSPFAEWPRYFDRRLHAAWPGGSFDALQPIAERRNAAAHGRTVSAGGLDQLLRDINDVWVQGAAIAIKVAEINGIALRDATYRFMSGR
jgi:hypothetical protein